MWGLIAAFGLNLLQQGQQKKQVKANNIVVEANAKAQNTVTAATNELAAAQGSLARYRQSLANQTFLKNVAKEGEAIGKNLGRLQEQSINGGINTRLRAAEATGTIMAAASAAGVGGATVDILQQTVEAQAARQQEMDDRNLRAATSDASDKLTALTEQAFLGLNTTQYIDRVTQVKAVANTQKVPSAFDMLSGALIGTVSNPTFQQGAIDAVSKIPSLFGARAQS
ncbi:internal virion protein [Pseudomonas phage vB_PpuP-Kurepalu-1]